MKKIFLMFSLLPFTAFAETDAQIALNQAIEIARTNCSGISARMDKIKKMAGIGTAINAVGTATGIGGVVAGGIKYNTDVRTANAVIEKNEVDKILAALKIKQNAQDQTIKFGEGTRISDKLRNNLQALMDKVNEEEVYNKKEQIIKDRQVELQKEIDKSQQKATIAGNVRTGMFAVDAVSNVAGAVTASQTIADDEFLDQIKKCIESVDELRTAHSRSKFEDGDDINVQQMDLGQKIISKCGEYQYVDFKPLNNLAKGAIVANSVGAATGTVATITSALGNKQKMSDIDMSSTQVGQKLNNHLKMNMASNVMGGVTAAASLTGTVLNASQIKTTKQVLSIAQECEEALTW